MKGAKFLAPALLLLGMLFAPRSVFAIDTPDFPACANPQGTKIVDVGFGTHGIVGDQNTYTGADKVWLQDNGNLMQCFCSVTANGIQTNWWRVSSLTESELSILKADGWIYVPSGAPWGLSDSEYMAKNNGFSCVGSYGGGNSGSSNSLVGQVLGLAFTGNIAYVYAFLGAGMFLITLGFVLTKSK